MTSKQKILDAIECTFDDISENRLIDILLDAYQKKKDRINELEGENAREREQIHFEHERMQEEYRRMRSDPFYCATGTFFFVKDDQKFIVEIQGNKITLSERVNNKYDKLFLQVTRYEWDSL